MAKQKEDLTKEKVDESVKINKFEIKLLTDYSEFLKKYQLITIAAAFVIGAAVKDLTKSFSQDLVMPFITTLSPDTWQNYVLQLGEVKLGIGHFLSVLFEFLLIAFLLFIIINYKANKVVERRRKAYFV